MSARVNVRDALAAAGLAKRLDDVTDTNSSSDAYLVPAPVRVEHKGGYLLAVAFFEDDQWWLDFTNYGDDLDSQAPEVEPSGGDDAS